LHVPARKNSAFAARGTRSARQAKSRAELNSIVAHRARLVAEVTRLRARGENSKFIDNAQQLLTRWWSTAGWHAREQLLKTADWLIRLEKRRGGRAQSPV